MSSSAIGRKKFSSIGRVHCKASQNPPNIASIINPVFLFQKAVINKESTMAVWSKRNSTSNPENAGCGGKSEYSLNKSALYSENQTGTDSNASESEKYASARKKTKNCL